MSHRKDNRKRKSIPPKKKTGKSSRATHGEKRNPFYIIAVLVITFVVFIPSLNNDFVNWDDDVNILENNYVRELNGENVKKIFTTHVIGNYNPLTILSFAVDYHFWGENARPYHAINLLLHILCTALVFLIIRLLGGSYMLAFIVAMLFGIHPMRVESVAWVTERKDVLFGFFYLLALICYVRLLQKKKLIFYFLAIIFFVFSLLSKIQAVALPLSMLMIDYLLKRPLRWKLVVEKIPFFILSLATGIIGIYFLQQAESLEATNIYPIFQRIFVGMYSLVVYIIKSIVPYEMSALYPYPKIIPAVFYLSVIVIIFLVYVVIRSARKTRHVVFGTLFFFLNIVFLLQVLGAGQGFLADRFTYIPYLGLFYLYGRGFESLYDSRKKLRPFIISAGFIYLIIMGAVTWKRCDVWQDGGTLWTDVLKKYDNIATPHNNLGKFYRENNRYDEALPHYNRAIALNPDGYLAYNNRGKIYFEYRQFEKALADYNKAIELNPDYAEGYANRGSVYGQLQQYEKAIDDLSKAIELDPGFSQAYANRSLVYFYMKEYEKAIEDCTIYLQFNPDDDGFYNHRAICYRNLNENEKALQDYNMAVRLEPANGVYYYNRFFCHKALGNNEEALRDADLAKRYGKEIPPEYLQEL